MMLHVHIKNTYLVCLLHVVVVCFFLYPDRRRKIKILQELKRRIFTNTSGVFVEIQFKFENSKKKQKKN